MVRSAFCPLAESQQFAVNWMENYFDTYGDKAPNRDEIHLLIMQKADVYKLYAHEFQNSSPPRKVISYSRFLGLWNALFPKCINRPWCDIPGKCDICYEIDKQRRTSEDAVVQEKLREAHHIHRGGMIMLERQE